MDTYIYMSDEEYERLLRSRRVDTKLNQIQAVLGVNKHEAGVMLCSKRARRKDHQLRLKF